MDQKILDMVDQVVEGKIDNEEIFTAWDITSEIRNSGENVRHWEVKAEVHNIFGNGGMPNYDRKTMDIGKGGDWPFVYFPDTTNQWELESWATAVRAGLVKQTGIPVFTAQTPSQAASVSSAVWKDADEQNRLRIPKSLLEEAGFSAEDEAWVEFDVDNQKVTISHSDVKPATSDSDDIVCKFLAIDEYTNLRISLNKLGFTALVYKIEVIGDTVVATGK